MNNLEKHFLRNDPIIYTIDNAVTDEECEHIINIAKPNLKRALVCGDKGSYIDSGRTNSSYWIRHDFDEITMNVCERISSIVNIPLEFAENMQIIYYDKNETYNRHYDGWKHDKTEYSFRLMNNSGQRLVTAFCYLNTVEKGGSTCFTKLNIHVPAEKGKLLTFHNVYTNTNKLHPDTEHSGMPVLEGEKYAFNLWFREVPRGQTLKEYDEKKYLEILPVKSE